MRFAFCIYKYFPFGGQQQHFLKIAEECKVRGHEVDVYATSWQGEFPEGLNVSIFTARGLTNHRRCESFADKLNIYINQNPYDAVLGFNKMPGLDVYYAADTCFAAKINERNILYRLTTRCRSYLRLERAVFDKHSKTEILLLSEREKQFFQEYYDTPNNRFHLLPPGISKDRLSPPNAAGVREELRHELGILPDQKIVLMVGSGFKTKGVDRAIHAMASLPHRLRDKTILLIVGQDNNSAFIRLARREGVADQVRFLGGRGDIPRFFVASDLLLHPAYRENTGNVLIEAMAAELPVLATDVCGYSFHIERAGAGKILDSPFNQKALNKITAFMLTSDERPQWQRNAKKYIAATDVFSRAERAVDILEQVAGRQYGI